MKKLVSILSSCVLAAAVQAGVIPFDLSPAGTDAAVGLSPLNQVPPATNSTASGNEISAGISFDTNSLELTVTVGFGAAAGFTDLSAPITALHIHGPAGPGTNGPVIVGLQPYLFTQGPDAVGGIIYGKVPIPTNAVAGLLAGLDYINIHTTNYPGGEIRAQLIPQLNQAPVVSCPDPATVECGGATTLSAKVSDPNGDALTVVWSVNGVGLQTNELAAGTTTVPVDSSFTAEYPLGTNAITVTATDSAGNTSDCSTTVIVVDTIPPVITKVTANPDVLWPPNHKMVTVQLSAWVTDICGDTTWKVVGVTSSEGVNATGSGNTSPDWAIIDDHTVSLRAERSGITGPRTYTITVQATDAAGNVSQPKSVDVVVLHDRGSDRGK
jgi:hypothetical protein